MVDSLSANNNLPNLLPLDGPMVADPALVNSSQWSKVTTMEAYPDYRLRVKSPKICDSSVKQYSGYLDTAEDKHFFFWFFEARHPAKTGDTPVILWTNGGPGCSSLVGVLMELGPCRVNKGGTGTTANPYAWNENAHVIFIDQPLNTGFSYGQRVDNSYDAGKDVNIFLRMFYYTFPQYASSQLHIFGESYAGHYVPAIGKAIHEANQALAKKQHEGTLTKAEESIAILPLASIGIGNGLVDVRTQYKYYAKMACNSTYPPVLSQFVCNAMDAAVPSCTYLIEQCYYWQNRLACIPADIYCQMAIMEPYTTWGRHNNPYNVNMPCKKYGKCYDIDDDITAFLNRRDTQRELGVEVRGYTTCSQRVHIEFLLSGDSSKPLYLEIPPLLDAGIRVLVYAGDADWICNWYGNKAYAQALEWPGQTKFSQAEDLVWSVDGEEAGEVRMFENLTFVRVYGSGHFVPYDRPKSALDMVNRWISNKPFVSALDL
ncbi:hypothetical protein GGI06_001613 [Coemansia sp. S85]|nr:hypothetical protein GGI06_001613 [Coemansia sp. S85]